MSFWQLWNHKASQSNCSIQDWVPLNRNSLSVMLMCYVQLIMSVSYVKRCVVLPVPSTSLLPSLPSPSSIRLALVLTFTSVYGALRTANTRAKTFSIILMSVAVSANLENILLAVVLAPFEDLEAILAGAPDLFRALLS